ncbi:MAG TPA: hypothetical protein VN958_08065 [Chitinophagaceae bacterium]|nr:hypothetical protein [Chitinophagaceae bacterium]
MNAFNKVGLPEPVIEEHAGGIQITFLKDIYTREFLVSYGLEERHIQTLLLNNHRIWRWLCTRAMPYV